MMAGSRREFIKAGVLGAAAVASGVPQLDCCRIPTAMFTRRPFLFMQTSRFIMSNPRLSGNSLTKASKRLTERPTAH